MDPYILNCSKLTNVPFYAALSKAAASEPSVLRHRCSRRLSKRIRALFLAAGWRPTFLDRALSGLCDRMFTESHDELAIAKGLATIWLSERYRPGHIRNSLLQIGIDRTHVDAAYAVFNPLRDTCYTDEQLMLMAIEYCLEIAQPIIE